VRFDLETDIALDAVISAAALCKVVRAEMVPADSFRKGDQSPVTVADFGAQALICQRLNSAFPRDHIVSEEDSRALRRPENAATLDRVAEYVRRFDSPVTPEQVCLWIDAGKGPPTERFWTLDPIDGTKGFLRHDQYAVALALIVRGQVRLAVLGCPALPFEMDEPDSLRGVVFVALRAEGAMMRPLSESAWQPIHVDDGSDAMHMRLVESVEAAHGDLALQEAVARSLRLSAPPLRMDSQAKYGAVARSDAALYLRLPSPSSPDYRENIWDHAAGSLIVEEAGGKVTDIRGTGLDFASGAQMRNSTGVVVSNGCLHQDVLAALAHVVLEPERKAEQA